MAASDKPEPPSEADLTEWAANRGIAKLNGGPFDASNVLAGHYLEALLPGLRTLRTALAAMREERDALLQRPGIQDALVARVRELEAERDVLQRQVDCRHGHLCAIGTVLHHDNLRLRDERMLKDEHEALQRRCEMLVEDADKHRNCISEMRADFDKTRNQLLDERDQLRDQLTTLTTWNDPATVPEGPLLWKVNWVEGDEPSYYYTDHTVMDAIAFRQGTVIGWRRIEP